ncbi:MAG: adenylyltransferase/cytidyltransferase family protein [Spirochaetes bacterium]|jgi:cytidyltransferase-like protein|nr:adenylyltransferase/cytidyltransferase family protein [Spirochaetota bacterium]
MDAETHGVIIGRFMPPHAGHQYLVDFGRNVCDRLTVLVCTLSSEPIPGELRYRWMQELFPDVHMVHITEEIPEASKDSPTAIPIWAETVRAYLSATPTYVFASEDYGAPLAAELGARFVPVDPARRQFPVSATMIRENPLANWDYIPEPVRPYFLRRVSVVESHGARTGIAGGPSGPGDAGGPGGGQASGRAPGPSMAQRLAAHYQTLYVSDYGRFWEDTVGRIGEDDLPLVQRAQLAVENSLARRASRVLFCESDALQIAVRRGFAAGEPGNYDVTLLVEPHGRNKTGADAILDPMEAALTRRGAAVVRITAETEHELLDKAVAEVERVLGARAG